MSKIRQQRMKKKVGSSLYVNLLPGNGENIKPRTFFGFCPFWSVLSHVMFYSILVQRLCIQQSSSSEDILNRSVFIPLKKCELLVSCDCGCAIYAVLVKHHGELGSAFVSTWQVAKHGTAVFYTTSRTVIILDPK